MSSLPLHPALVHVPLGLALAVPLLAIGVLAVYRRDGLPRKAWGLVAGLQAVLVLGALVAMRTGSSEEDTAERVVSERAIAAHEEAAELFTWGAAGVLVLAGVVLLLPPGTARKGGVAATLGMLAVAGLAVRTGHAGGLLVYQHNAGAAYGSAAAASGGSGATVAGASGEGRGEDRDRHDR